MSETVETRRKPPVPQQPQQPQQQPPAAQDVPARKPCVGLPVVYQTEREAIPGVLQRRGITEPDLWDVRVFPNGAMTSVVRSAVRYSAVPRPGYWSFLPE